MKIKLKDGTLVSVDDNWRDLVAKYFIGARNPTAFYLQRNKTTGYIHVIFDNESRLLHRALLNHYGKEKVDHKDGNILNNKLENLRLCSHTQNQMNKKIDKRNLCGFKGVRKTKYGTYMANIKLNGVQKYLGSYKTIEEAAEAYDTAALELFGEFAKTNKMLGLL